MPLDQMPEDFQIDRKKARALYGERLAHYTAACRAEGDKIRAVGGLYVIGSERHDSRRIDNQLRGRSGRQGDPGASRFFLSLEDDLMRLFATGALNFVMGRALPDDEAIEAKMVTKAIERAQTTVETKNAEIRKNVLKYDEVMNEQRKIIYKRRDQILDGEDLRSAGVEYLAEAVDSLISTHCASAADDEWDIDALAKELTLYWPNSLTEAQLKDCADTDEIYDLVMENATAHYEHREAELGEEVLRQVERQVMLRIIDQRWREHLEEMDYLQTGINLRAMGQKDPLVEWQREGFEMFGAMMTGIAQDFVKYVMHVQVVQNQAGAPTSSDGRGAIADPADANQDGVIDAAEAGVSNLTTSSSDDVDTDGFGGAVAGGGDEGMPAAAAPNTPSKQQTVVKDDFSKTPRNAPCPCGSGKKFKNCHGES
jgi:preprotein translocase subunit SecA